MDLPGSRPSLPLVAVKTLASDRWEANANDLDVQFGFSWLFYASPSRGQLWECHPPLCWILSYGVTSPDWLIMIPRRWRAVLTMFRAVEIPSDKFHVCWRWILQNITKWCVNEMTTHETTLNLRFHLKGWELKLWLNMMTTNLKLLITSLENYAENSCLALLVSKCLGISRGVACGMNDFCLLSGPQFTFRPGTAAGVCSTTTMSNRERKFKQSPRHSLRRYVRISLHA